MQYLLGLYEKSMPNHLSWEEKMYFTKEAGYDFLEVSIDESDKKQARLNMSQEERLKLVTLCNKIGVPIKTMCLSGHRKYPLGSSEAETAARSLVIMEKAIELACDLGIRIIQIAGYDVYYEESTPKTVARFKTNLAKCVKIAAKNGVVLGFETMETAFMNTVEKAMKYVNEINSPYLKVYPDIGNLTNSNLMYNTNLLDDLEIGKGSINACHLKETVPNVFREVEYGAGHVNFVSCIEKLWDIGVRMFVGEFWYTGNNNWQDILIRNHKFLRDKFDQIPQVLD